MKTHCGKGHEFTKENTYYRPGSTKRECKQCINAWNKKRKDWIKAMTGHRFTRAGVML